MEGRERERERDDDCPSHWRNAIRLHSNHFVDRMERSIGGDVNRTFTYPPSTYWQVSTSSRIQGVIIYFRDTFEDTEGAKANMTWYRKNIYDLFITLYAIENRGYTMEIESSSPPLSYLSLIFVAQTMKSNSILCNINLSIPTIILNKTNRRVRDAILILRLSRLHDIYITTNQSIYTGRILLRFATADLKEEGGRIDKAARRRPANICEDRGTLVDGFGFAGSYGSPQKEKVWRKLDENEKNNAEEARDE